jgi:hypothetical protein
MENSKADLEDPHLNTSVLSKHALIRSLENQKPLFLSNPKGQLVEKAIMHD